LSLFFIVWLIPVLSLLFIVWLIPVLSLTRTKQV
jgi:hypothetical protein